MIPSPWHQFLRSLSSLISGRPSRSRPFRKKASRRARLGIERLEDRLVPAAVRDLAGFTANTLPPTDDGSTDLVALGFDAAFRGTTYSSLYVNNNGNVTFDDPLSAYLPYELTGASIPIIAPFFADVDTRGPGSGVVTYGQDTVEDGHAAFGVNWIGVGYYDRHDDLLNSFQLVLIDRSDIAPGAFDIEFNYDQIEWELGDESEGVSARAGYAGGVELSGSGVNGAFLDDNTTTGLIHSSYNSTVAGRYFFEVRGAGGNQTPVAADDSYGVDEDGTLDVAVAEGVLSNDSDPDPSDMLSVTGHDSTSAQGAAVAVSGDGSFSYDPTGAAALQALGAGQTLEDAFGYTISDGQGASDTATVIITVTGVNDAPVLDNTGDMALTPIDEDDVTNNGTLVSAIIASADLPDRITDVDAGAVEGIAVTGVDTSNGTWQFSSSGNQSWTDFGSPSETEARLLAADENTRIRFLPDPDFNGSATIAFRAWDQTSGSNGETADVTTNGGSTAFSAGTETASITVNPVNDPPVAQDDSYSSDEDSTLDVAVAQGVLNNDSDPDVPANTLSASVLNGPGNGSLTLNSDGSFTYTPNANWNGIDRFTYEVNDGQGGTASGMVTITVSGINDAPVATDDSYSVDVDGTLSGNVLNNDSDEHAGAPGENNLFLTAQLVTGPSDAASFTLNSDGSFAYTPNPSWNGEDSFTYQAVDSLGGVSTTATVTIYVGSGTGLTGNYFVNPDFTGLVLTQTDSTVDADWGAEGPDAVVGNDLFSVRWSGQVQASFSETHTFSTISDGGVRLWVNGQLLIDDWMDHLTTTLNSGTISLVAGQRYDIMLEYFEGQEAALVQLRWSSDSLPEEIIPQSQLYPNAFRFSAAKYSADEGDTNVTVTVERIGSTTGSASVSYSIDDAFVTASGKGDRLISPQTGTVTFAPGETSRTLTIPLGDDGWWQGEEYMILTLDSPSQGYGLDQERSWAWLSIQDNEIPPPDDYDGSDYTPVAGDDYFYANFDNPTSFSLENGDSVLANDFDYLDRSLTITGYTSPVNGTVSFDIATGRFTYIPNAPFGGNDSFTYQISNGTATVTATVFLAHSALLAAESDVLVRQPAQPAPAANAWAVFRRSDDRWARVQSVNPATDTFEGLANKVGLNASEVAKWLSWENPAQQPQLTEAQNNAIRTALQDPTRTVQAVFPNQTEFWIPNTILAYWGGEVKQVGRFWVRWEADMQALVDKGYFVEYAGYKPVAEVQVTFNNPDLALTNPTEYWRRYNRLRVAAYYKAAQAAGTVEDPWTRNKFYDYMEDQTKKKALYGTYFWGHGWPAATVKGQNIPSGILLNAKVEDAAQFTMHAVDYPTWKSKLTYALGGGFIYGCYSAAAKTNNPATSVFSQNGIFWGSEKILVFPLAAPVLQKILRTRLPEITVGVGEAKLTFNPPLIEKVLNDNKQIK